MKKKIVITGGLGYIGTELCKLYSGVSWHHEIIVIDNRFFSERVNQIRNWNMKFIQGDIYRSLAEKRAIKDVIIPANRGNIYSAKGNLLATSVQRYEIRIDLVTPSNKNFEMFKMLLDYNA